MSKDNSCPVTASADSTPPTSGVILRKQKEQLTDGEKYTILAQYGDGVPTADIARAVSRDKKEISNFIQSHLKAMNTVRETNDLIVGTHTLALNLQMGKTPTKFLTSSFIALLETNAEQYAYFYSQTGDNKFSLQQSGLDVGIAKNLKATTKEYVYRIRGQFIRDLAPVKKIIQLEQDRRISEYRIEKPQIQMELVNQIEELKELTVNDVRQRVNLLKAIEMLGRTIGSFTDRVEVEETDAKSGLEILMAKVKGEIYEQAKEE